MKNLLLFTLLIIYSLTTKSQNWCPPGAIWHYKLKVYMSNGIDGVVEFKYTGNQLVNNINCKVITATFRGYQLGASYLNNNTTIPNVMSYITYESNQVVYLYNGATFDTVVNFNAAIGDKWLELKNPTGASCFNARSHNIVTDTGRIMINNVNLKKISTTCTYTVTEDNAVTTHTSNNVFIERLLGQSSLAFSNYGNMFRFHCYRGERTDEPSFGFICYEDNTFPLYNVSGSSCDNLTGLRDNYLSSSQIQIYPNPANEMVNFKYELSQDNTRFKLSVINSLGQLVNEVMLQHTQQPAGSQTAQIGTENLPEGVYILKLTSIETSQQSQSAKDVVVKRFVISR